MSYIDFFELEREPFSNAPDARFYLNTEQHSQALLRLMHAVDFNRGFALLVGGVGTGKTTLARRMLENLPESQYESSLLVMVHSGITAEWILTRIAVQLGVSDPGPDRLTILRQLYDRLIEIEKSGRKAVVLIDEAQMLQTRELMEEFRGLLNIEIPGRKLLNIIFFGLPEVEECLKLDEPLAQRLAIRFELKSFTCQLTESYVKHRLKVAGARRFPFTANAIRAIHDASRGIPRLINTICDNCLFEAFLRRVQTVDSQIVAAVLGDLGISQAPHEEPAVVKEPEEFEDIENMLDQLGKGS